MDSNNFKDVSLGRCELDLRSIQHAGRSPSACALLCSVHEPVQVELQIMQMTQQKPR